MYPYLKIEVSEENDSSNNKVHTKEKDAIGNLNWSRAFSSWKRKEKRERKIWKKRSKLENIQKYISESCYSVKQRMRMKKVKKQ